MESLPELLWSFSAFVTASDEPRHYLSRGSLEAYLAAGSDYGSYCSVEKQRECVWWAVVSPRCCCWLQ